MGTPGENKVQPKPSSLPAPILPSNFPCSRPSKQEDRASAKDMKEESKFEPEWDFILPKIIWAHSIEVGGRDFHSSDPLAAIQNKSTPRSVQNYLGYYDQSAIKKHINETIHGYPAMFYAVYSNDEGLIRLLVQYGGDVNCVHEGTGIPLLAWAIVMSESLQQDTSLSVATLLSLGASPQVIPSLFFTPCYKDFPGTGPTDQELEILPHKQRQWLRKSTKLRLVRTTHLTIRYYLERAIKMKQGTERRSQVVRRKKAEGVLGIPYFLIGQDLAANRLLQTLLNHLTLPSKKPLVLVFAGPSGHGKTELARRLGQLLSLDLEVVDCTIVRREMELFGPRHPYHGAENSSSLNSFLVRNSGQRSIVFMDEFEKTTKDIHQALLLPFDNGEYQDRRYLAKIDCSKTIWILATNACDSAIQNFCTLHEDEMLDDDDHNGKLQLANCLVKELKQQFLSHFDAPITGRISAFILFLPFSPGEQAVVVHKYLLELAEKVRAPVNLSPGLDEQLLGNIDMRIRRDASVCRALAEGTYLRELGARSLINAVRTVQYALVEAYLDVDTEIEESEEKVEFVVDENHGEVVANMRR